MAATESPNVLATQPPRFSAEEVAAIAAELFDLHGDVTDLGSERDQTFLVGDGVLKISNTGEDPAVLDLEAKALEHIGRVDPELPIARQRFADPVVTDGQFALPHGVVAIRGQ